MKDIHVTREQIEAKLKSLNIDKSPGPDLLHPRILYEVRQKIFDASLRVGEIPQE